MLAAALSAYAQDSDGDGVADAADAFPCDPTLASESFAPAEGAHGMIQFEDEWPDTSDLDFNDVVVTYNYRVRRNGSGAAVSVQATFNVLALGGTFTHGLGLQLPVPRQNVGTVTRTIGSGAAQALTPISSDANLTFRVFDDLRSLFGGVSGTINSVPAQSRLTAQTVRVDITLSTPSTLSAAAAPYDVFIFRSSNPSHEIHRSQFSGTSAMNAALFNTGNDASQPGRSFTDFGGLPYALVMPELASYPQEATDIAALFPNITGFASSGGVTNADFYRTGVVTARAFPSPNAPTFGAAPAAASLTCLPASACLALRNQGYTTDGVYMVDPDGPGGLAAFEVYCDMTTAGGGWTLISNRRANTTNTEACGSNIAEFFTNGCGTARAVGPSDSHALSATRRAAAIRDATQVMLLQYLNGVLDADDAYMMTLPVAGTDLFVNQTTVRDFAISRVCNLAGSVCDNNNVWFKYSGDSWYHSSVCTAGNWAGNTQYRGNYGLCHDGWTGASSSYSPATAWAIRRPSSGATPTKARRTKSVCSIAELRPPAASTPLAPLGRSAAARTGTSL